MSSCVVPHYRLLLIDSHPPRLEAIATLLRGLGYGVTCAANAERAHAVMELAKVDAVISISNPEPLHGGLRRRSARPIVAVAISPPEEAPPNGAGGIHRLPLRAPDLVRAIRGGLDRLRDE